MPRPLRAVFPGAVHHVTLRGNDRQTLFLDETDYQRYLAELIRCNQEHGGRLLAYALMPNHVHLVFRDDAGTLSKYMQVLSVRYTRWFNERHRRLGHLYQGRFYAKLVNRDEYLLQVSRYVHLNPVRAHLVERPEDYWWSSYRAYIGVVRHDPSLLDPQLVWEMLTGNAEERPSAYRQFVDTMTSDLLLDWERRLRRLHIIGSARFATELRKCQTLVAR